MIRFRESVLLLALLPVGCGPTLITAPDVIRPETSPDPNDPLLAGKPLSFWKADLKKPSAAARRSAAAALGEPKAKFAAPPLIEALKDQEADVRATAARSLGIIGPDKDSIAALTTALRDPNPTVVVAAADALMRFKTEAKSAVPTLVELWKGKNNDIRGAAGAALNHIDREAAREAGVPQP